MKRLLVLSILIILLSSCLSFPFHVLPKPKMLEMVVAPYIEKYGDYDGYQVGHIFSDPVKGETVHVIFVWRAHEVYAVFAYFADAWFLMETNG